MIYIQIYIYWYTGMYSACYWYVFTWRDAFRSGFHGKPRNHIIKLHERPSKRKITSGVLFLSCCTCTLGLDMLWHPSQPYWSWSLVVQVNPGAALLWSYWTQTLEEKNLKSKAASLSCLGLCASCAPRRPCAPASTVLKCKINALIQVLPFFHGK